MSAIQDPEYLNVIMAEFGYDDKDEAEEAPNWTDYIYPSSWKGDSVQLLLERTSTRYGNFMEELKRDGVQVILTEVKSVVFFVVYHLNETFKALWMIVSSGCAPEGGSNRV